LKSLISKLTTYRFAIKASIVLLAFAVYHPILWNPFNEGDDRLLILENENVRSKSFNEVIYYFSHFDHGQYAPLNTLVYSIIYHTNGLDPFCFHLLSIAIHVINTLLVFEFVAQISKGRIYTLFLSTATAALFCVHPIQVEAIAWISAIKVLWYSLFFLLSLILYVRYQEEHKGQFYFLSLTTFILSVGFKEQAIIFPFVLLLLDFMLDKRNIRKLIFEKIPFFVVSISMGVATMLGTDAVTQINTPDNYSLIQRLILACWALGSYILNFLVPIRPVSADFPFSIGSQIPPFYYLYVLLLSFVAWALFNKIRQGSKMTVFGALFFFFNLILCLNILPMSRPVLLADRYLYIPSIGIWLILVNFSMKYIDTKIIKYIFCGIVLSLSIISYWLSVDWNATNALLFDK